MRNQGEQIVTEFLDCFHSRTGTYPQDLYKAFGSEIDDAHNHTIFRKRLVDEILMSEQNDRCCYCMRKLSSCNTITVEHVMPNHAIDKAELDLYRTRKTELDGLPHPDDFKSQAVITYPPHPHSIAYQNLVLSCDGDFFNENSRPQCCNLKRKHTFLLPFIFYPNVNQTFVYMSDGTAEWREDPEPMESPKNAVRILGLNKSLLKMIRRIWFFCNDNNLNPRIDERDTIINTMIGYMNPSITIQQETDLLLNFKLDKYWKLLLEYDSFATISHI